VSQGGAKASENAGMSSDKACEKHAHRKPEVSYARLIRVGLVGPKPYRIGKAMDNGLVFPYHLVSLNKGGTQEGRLSAPIGHGALPIRGAGASKSTPA